MNDSFSSGMQNGTPWGPYFIQYTVYTPTVTLMFDLSAVCTHITVIGLSVHLLWMVTVDPGCIDDWGERDDCMIPQCLPVTLYLSTQTWVSMKEWVCIIRGGDRGERSEPSGWDSVGAELNSQMSTKSSWCCCFHSWNFWEFRLGSSSTWLIMARSPSLACGNTSVSVWLTYHLNDPTHMPPPSHRYRQPPVGPVTSYTIHICPLQCFP